MLTLTTVAALVSAPLLGAFVGRHPYHRSTLVLAVVAPIVTAWTAVLVWPGTAPVWLLVVLMLAMGIGGPVSMVGFDFVRSFNPSPRMGGATGIVNQGGFFATCWSSSPSEWFSTGAPPGRAPTTRRLTSLGRWRPSMSPGPSGYRRKTRRELCVNDPERYARLRVGYAAAR